MEKFKYSHRLSTGCIVAGGTLSSLIPPSVPFIVYGVLTETSIAKLFIAGILPGLLLSALYLSVIIIMCKRNPQLGAAGPSYPWREMLASLKGVLGVLILFVLVMGGLFAGVFAPSEAGAIGAFGAFVIALAKRRLTISTLITSVRDALITSCFILTITTGAMIFSNFLTVAHFSEMFGGWIDALPISRHFIMIVILFIYIPLGMFMDALSMILLTLPIVFPVVMHLGFDPVWFGIMLTLMAEMGLTTPPVALNVYVVSGVTKVPLSEVFYGAIPFFSMMFLCMIFLYAFPQITLYLPGVMR
jgi:tripartite ATP-independent transporter DctM subunit